jgi:hypothetical protein
MSKSKPHNQRKYYWLAAIIVVVLIVSLVIGVKHHNDNARKNRKVIPAETPTESSVNKPSLAKTSNSTSSASADKAIGSASPSPTSQLSEPPSGTFVSNHKPSLGGSSSPSQEQSSCNSVPGAKCYIEFTKGDAVKTLPIQTLDNNGTAIWNWDIKTAGFSVGNWQIKAVVSLNGQSKSSSDNMSLEVQP